MEQQGSNSGFILANADFAIVVERCSIFAAARQMGQTHSAVSKQIGQLEDQVRYRLLNRTRSGARPPILWFAVSCTATAIFWNDVDDVEDQNFEAIGSFEENSTAVIFRATLAGIGIARLPRYMTDQVFASGELVHVIPEYAPPGTDIAVMFAARPYLAPKTRAFVDLLVGHFAEIVTPVG